MMDKSGNSKSSTGEKAERGGPAKAAYGHFMHTLAATSATKEMKEHESRNTLASGTIEERVAAIEERNARVETDKNWEQSLTRRGFLALIIGFVAGMIMSFMGTENAWLLAMVPVLGYTLSTLSLPYLRNMWMKSCGKKQKSEEPEDEPQESEEQE